MMSFTPPRYHLTTLRKSVAYDVAMRLPMLVWSVGLGFALVLELQHYSRAAIPENPRPIYLLNIAMRLSMIAYLVILATTVASRTRPLQRARGAEPRITALLGSFLLPLSYCFLAAIFQLPSAAYRLYLCSSET
jgi:hypothetical protein